MKAHGAQKRASGDPYFSHPIEVAGILTDLKLDDSSIITALLHDVVEDTDTTLEDVEALFGKEISHLVDGVTKLGRLELQSEETKHAENFRKRSEEHTSELQSLMRISYAVFCLKKKKKHRHKNHTKTTPKQFSNTYNRP